MRKGTRLCHKIASRLAVSLTILRALPRPVGLLFRRLLRHVVHITATISAAFDQIHC